MRIGPLLALSVAACASVPASSREFREGAVFQGYTADEVRQAAVQTLNGLSRFIDPARITGDGRVVSEYAASGWTSFEVRFDERDGATAAEVRIASEPRSHCYPWRLPFRVSAAQARAARITVERGAEGFDKEPVVYAPRIAADQSCPSETTWGGPGAREILDRIGAGLESASPDG